MPTCDRIRKQLSYYAVGGLRGRARARVASHLTACPACRDELAALERTAALLNRVGAVSAPAGTWEAVSREILASPRLHVGPRARLSWRLAIGGLGLLLLLSGGVALEFRRPAGPQPTPVTRTASDEDDMQMALETQLSAQWVTPLADAAAVGLRIATLEGG